jgi:hypothetical protein
MITFMRPEDIDICGDGRRHRIRALCERLQATRDRAIAAALRQRLRAEIDEPRTCRATRRDIEICRRCLERQAR